MKSSQYLSCYVNKHRRLYNPAASSEKNLTGPLARKQKFFLFWPHYAVILCRYRCDYTPLLFWGNIFNIFLKILAPQNKSGIWRFSYKEISIFWITLATHRQNFTSNTQYFTCFPSWHGIKVKPIWRITPD